LFYPVKVFDPEGNLKEIIQPTSCLEYEDTGKGIKKKPSIAITCEFCGKKTRVQYLSQRNCKKIVCKDKAEIKKKKLVNKINGILKKINLK